MQPSSATTRCSIIGAPRGRQSSICKTRGSSMGSLAEVEVRRARTACKSVLACGDTDLRVFDAWTGYWVAEWRWGRLRWLACWFTALLRCVCAAADGGEHTPRVVAPAPVITAGRLFQRARLRNNHGANSAYLSRWPS